MNNKQPLLTVLFTLIMLCCVAFFIWYVPAMGARRFQLEDLQISLETSMGRERKQQHEYDETVAAFPEVEAELNEITPRKEQAEQEVADLKAQRKLLREEKEKLSPQETAQPADGAQEGGDQK